VLVSSPLGFVLIRGDEPSGRVWLIDAQEVYSVVAFDTYLEPRLGYATGEPSLRQAHSCTSIRGDGGTMA
jgi:hypothetical protein